MGIIIIVSTFRRALARFWVVLSFGTVAENCLCRSPWADYDGAMAEEVVAIPGEILAEFP